jgi:hypothetical protein
LAQKSLPVLNKVGTSMIWYTTFFYKYYRWLSSQSIYLLYFINKILVYTNFIFSKLLWISFYSNNLYIKKIPKQIPRFKKKKFFKPLTSYLINTGQSLSIVNIFYKTTLENFQELSKRTDEQKTTTIRLNFDKKFKNTFFC